MAGSSGGWGDVELPESPLNMAVLNTPFPTGKALPKCDQVAAGEADFKLSHQVLRDAHSPHALLSSLQRKITDMPTSAFPDLEQFLRNC